MSPGWSVGLGARHVVATTYRGSDTFSVTPRTKPAAINSCDNPAGLSLRRSSSEFHVTFLYIEVRKAGSTRANRTVYFICAECRSQRVNPRCDFGHAVPEWLRCGHRPAQRECLYFPDAILQLFLRARMSIPPTKTESNASRNGLGVPRNYLCFVVPSRIRGKGAFQRLIVDVLMKCSFVDMSHVFERKAGIQAILDGLR